VNSRWKPAAAVLLAVLACVSGASAQTPADKKIINLALGSVTGSSNVYAFSVALSNVVRKHDPVINVTAVEGGGGFDHARLMKQGVLEWSVSGSPAVVAEVREGTGTFKKEGAWEPIRLMFMRNVSVSRLYVRADVARKQNIRTWSDLAGKTLSPGIPGTRDMTRALEANKLLAANIKMIPSSFDDAVRRIKEGGLIALLKGSPHDRFDSGILEAHQGTPLTVIGFKKEDADRIAANNPLDSFIMTPAGGIREAPDAGPFLEMSSPVMVMASSRMPQDVGNRIMKAVYRGWKEIGEAFPPSQGLKPIEDAFRQTPELKELHFHAGVIQFAKENGIAVPARFIPPEYKGPR
jgi:uncharacterized protein